MQKYITDTLRNNLKSVIRELSVPQQKAVSEVTRGLMGSSGPILRHLSQNADISAKKQAEKYSHHLGNIDLLAGVEAVILRHTLADIKRYSIIAYDLSDIAKESAQKMERLSRVFDGSKRRTTTGYTFHGVGINQMLVKAQIHDGDKCFLPQVRRQILTELIGKLPKQKLSDGTTKPHGVGVFDRGNDCKQFFADLRSVFNLDFIARLKTNRQVVDTKTGGVSKVSELKPGQYEVYLFARNNNKVDTNMTYRLVISQHLYDKEPIRLLTTLPKKRFSQAQIVRIYLERWGVENSFKRIKQKFQLEKIRVLQFSVFHNLVALTLFCMAISTLIFQRLQKANTDLIAGLILHYKLFIKRWSLSVNLDSFISFIQLNIPPLITRQKHPPNQLPLIL